MTVVEELDLRYGVPFQILTNEGAEFESMLFTRRTKLKGIEKTRTTSYHPNGNGWIER